MNAVIPRPLQFCAVGYGDRAVQCLIAQAERHVIEGAARIGRLETMIADLDRKGRDIRDAKAILATMRVTQTHNEGDCLSLLKQL